MNHFRAHRLAFVKPPSVQSAETVRRKHRKVPWFTSVVLLGCLASAKDGQGTPYAFDGPRRVAIFRQISAQHGKETLRRGLTLMPNGIHEKRSVVTDGDRVYPAPLRYEHFD